MGHKKRQRKKYNTPGHPWEGERINVEKEFLKNYGMKNKKEIWKIESNLRKMKRQAKKLIASTDDQADKEKKELIDRLVKLGIVKPGAQLEDILDLKTEDLCDRRLQTLIVKKNMAKSINQARQFIVHGHIALDGDKVTTPSRLISKDEESKISFLGKSTLSKADHPERKVDEDLKHKILKKEKEEVKKVEEKIEEIADKKEDKVKDGKETEIKESKAKTAKA